MSPKIEEALRLDREQIIQRIQEEIDANQKERETMEDPVESQALFLYIVGLTSAQRLIKIHGSS